MMYGRRTASLSRSWHMHSGVPALTRRKRLNQREKENSNSCDEGRGLEKPETLFRGRRDRLIMMVHRLGYGPHPRHRYPGALLDCQCVLRFGQTSQNAWRLAPAAAHTVQRVMACFSDVMGSLSGTNSWAK